MTFSLPSPKVLRGASFSEVENWIKASRQTAQRVLSREDGRIAIIVGPCSVHHFEGALEYAERLGKLAKKVSSSCLLIMRVFCEKPRTIGGWKGLVYDPYLDGSNQISEGLMLSRKLLLELAKREIPTATEFVDPLVAPYIEDLVTWGFIGARTSASPPHRHLVSKFDFPVGFKNGLDGNVDHAIHALLVAKKPQTFLGIDENGILCIRSSDGNSHTHLVLRGSTKEPNYSSEVIAEVIAKMEEWEITPRVMIDCAHGNCQKQYQKQLDVFREVLSFGKQREIIGFMLESYLRAGNQFHPPYSSDISVTDPCVDWESTESLIEEVASSSLPI